MATPFQDFDAQSEEGVAISGTLQLGGRIWALRSSDDVPFDLMRRLMAAVPPDSSVQESDEEKVQRGRETVQQMLPFFQAAIVRDQVEDFTELFSSPTSPVTVGNVNELMKFVSTCIFNTDGAQERPTKPSRSSSPGRSKTGRTSKVTSSAVDTLKAASGD